MSLAYLDCCAYDQLHSEPVIGCTVSEVALRCVRKVINKIWAAICYFDNNRFMTPTCPSIETNFGINRCVRSCRMASFQPTSEKSSTTMFTWVFGGYSSSWWSCKPIPTCANPVYGFRYTASLITIWLINYSIIGVSLIVKVEVDLALIFTWHWKNSKLRIIWGVHKKWNDIWIWIWDSWTKISVNPFNLYQSLDIGLIWEIYDANCQFMKKNYELIFLGIITISFLIIKN